MMLPSKDRSYRSRSLFCAQEDSWSGGSIRSDRNSSGSLARCALAVFLLGSIAICLAFPQRLHAQDSAKQLRKKLADRSAQLGKFYPELQTRGDEREKIAKVTLLTEEAVKTEARKRGISVTDDEVATFLIPVLSRQGLIDITKKPDVRTDENVQKWLTGQAWTMDQLFDSGRTLLLWIKVAVADVSVTSGEVESYMKDHPDVASVPVRTQLILTQFQIPARTRGLAQSIAQADLLSPARVSTSRSVNQIGQQSRDWQGLKLYVDLNKLDPLLRKALEGKSVGDNFGPLQLSNGNAVAGRIAAILPAVDFRTSDGAWQYASLLTRLNKVDKKAEFDGLVKTYFAGADVETRGLFGDILGVVGTGIGALFGGVGAPIGGIVGGMVGGWVDGQMSAPGPAQQFSFPPPPPPQAFNGFLQGPPPFMPPFFQGNFQMPSPPPFIPPMPQGYQNQFAQWANAFSMAPPPPPWFPPFFYPMPVRYY